MKTKSSLYIISNPLWARIILAILSFFFPGLGQAIQRRYHVSFDFIIFWGACLYFGNIYILKLELGFWSTILHYAILLVPAVSAAIDALLSKRHFVDADTVVRNIFLYVFLYILCIGPYHLLNWSFGYKTYLIPADNSHLEPVLLPGDMVVFARSSYGVRVSHPESISVGDLIFHRRIPEEPMSKAQVHWVLATPGDTLMALNSELTVNGSPLHLPILSEYSGNPNFGPIIVPDGQLFIVDNTWQMFPLYAKSIYGKATAILWSKHPKGGFRFFRFGSKIGNSAQPETQ